MRVIAGTLKRRTLRVPKQGGIRPTTDRTREALFDRLQFRVDWERASVLDLFAGSGAVGIEAVSRGAEHAVFVESDPRTFAVLTGNLSNLGIADTTRAMCADVFRYLSRHRGPGFDLIFADPPYGLPQIAQLPDAMLAVLAPGGLAVLEHDRHQSFESHPAFVDARSYGRSHLSFFEPESNEAPHE